MPTDFITKKQSLQIRIHSKEFEYELFNMSSSKFTCPDLPPSTALKVLAIREDNPFLSSCASNNRFLSLAEGLAENGACIDLMIIKGYSSKFGKFEIQKVGTKNRINHMYLLPYYMPASLIERVINKFAFKNHYYNLRKIKRLIGREKYDYIWLSVGKLIIRIGLKLMRTQKGVKFFHERSEFSWHGLLPDKKIHSKYLKEFIPQLDILAVMTSTLGNHYKEYIGEKTKIIHLPMTVDFSRFNKPIEDNMLNRPYIAYCGFMDNTKDGVDVLLQSFIKIMDRFPKLHLYLAGPILPAHDYLVQRSIISKHNAGRRVTYLDNLSREEMPSFLSNASVLALARPESKQAEGGFPTKLGEYLATGKPVCVTSVGEIGNYLKNDESAFIAKPGSVDAFSEALVKALTSAQADVIGAAGKKVAFEHFNKDIQAKTLHDFLQQNK